MTRSALDRLIDALYEAADLLLERLDHGHGPVGLDDRYVEDLRSARDELTAASEHVIAHNKSIPAMLVEFHEAFGQPFGSGDIRDFNLRQRLQVEETTELVDALAAGDVVAAAHELADVVYVAYGTAHNLGIPLDAVLAEVHRANMSKIGPDGPRFREDGKLLKPPSFRPAKIGAVLLAQAESAAHDREVSS